MTRKYLILLIAVALVAVVFAGCTSLSNDALTGVTPSATPTPIPMIIKAPIPTTIPPTPEYIIEGGKIIRSPTPEGIKPTQTKQLYLTDTDLQYIKEFSQIDYFSKALFYLDMYGPDDFRFKTEMIHVKSNIDKDIVIFAAMKTSSKFAPIKKQYADALLDEKTAAAYLEHDGATEYIAHIKLATEHIYKGNDLLDRLK